MLTLSRGRYDPITGRGAIGVEFAGTAVSSPTIFPGELPPSGTDQLSQILVAINPDLQWSEGFYRGFFTLTIDPNSTKASYYAMNDLSECIGMDCFDL